MRLLQRAADGRYGVGSILRRLGGVAVAARGLSRQLTVDPAVPAGQGMLRLAQVPFGGTAEGA